MRPFGRMNPTTTISSRELQLWQLPDRDANVDLRIRVRSFEDSFRRFAITQRRVHLRYLPGGETLTTP
jgi:hypothetical protein